MFNHFSDVTMYQVEVPNVPGDLADGEVVAGDVLQALWLHLEHDLEEENEDHEEVGHDGHAKGIARKRITVGDTMNDDDYR